MPPSTAATKAFSPGKRAHQRIDRRIIHGVENSAGAASAEPSPKVNEMTRSLLMPTSEAADGVERHRAHGGADSRLQHDEAQREQQHDGDHEHGDLIARNHEVAGQRDILLRKKFGKDFGFAPKTSWPAFCSSSETPMAVMSTVSVGASAQRAIGEPFDDDAEHARRWPCEANSTAMPTANDWWWMKPRRDKNR